MFVVAGDDAKHQSNDKETLDLDPSPAKSLNEEYREEVTRDVASHGNDEISERISQQHVVLGLARGKSNLAE